MDAVAIAAALCRRFEGFYPRPYLCSAGVPTIGYGATFYEDGTRVQLTDPPITQERAEQLLIYHLKVKFLPIVLRLCPRLWLETPERLAAILDWTFNLGGGNLGASTMRRKINAGEWELVPAEIRKWNKAAGRVLLGLTRRREAECDLI